MAKWKIVSTAPIEAQAVKSMLESFGAVPKGDEVDVVACPRDKGEDGLVPLIEDADIVVGDFTFQMPITEKSLNHAKKLKLIQQPSAGYQQIDVEAANKLNIPVANTAGANAPSVAEHTVMLVLALLKNVMKAHAATTSGKWPQLELASYELKGKNVSILGMGRIGKEVVRRFKSFEVNLCYYDKYRLTEEQEKEMGITYKPFPDILKSSDVVTIHVPLTKETEGWLGEKELGMMKSGAVLVNVARGGIVNEAALAEAVKKQKLFGAAADVFEKEPIELPNPLAGVNNLILTPHVAGVTSESRMRIIQDAMTNIGRVLRGEHPQDLVRIY